MKCIFYINYFNVSPSFSVIINVNIYKTNISLTTQIAYCLNHLYIQMSPLYDLYIYIYIYIYMHLYSISYKINLVDYCNNKIQRHFMLRIRPYTFTNNEQKIIRGIYVIHLISLETDTTEKERTC